MAWDAFPKDTANYELVYDIAICNEAAGQVADAYYAYRLAMLLCDDVKDREVIGQSFQHLCSYADASEYALSRACGDLAEMLYPEGVVPEEDYIFDREPRYTFVTDTKDMMDDRIETENPEGTGTLYMYRDSFGSALIPYLSEEFASATYSRMVPYAIYNVVTAKADTVIIERAERNIEAFQSRPALMQPLKGPETAEEIGGYPLRGTETVCEVRENGQYYQIDGEIDPACFTDDTEIYIALELEDGTQELYTPFYTSERGFRLYILRKENQVKVSVITENEGERCIVNRTNLSYNQ